MSKKELTYREKITKLIEDKSITDYRIWKETGLPLSSVQALRNGTTDIDKLHLKNAEIYSEFYDKLYGNS